MSPIFLSDQTYHCEDQRNRVLRGQNAESTDFRPYLLGLWLSGCRPSEMATRMIEDFGGDTWTVKKHKTAGNRKRARPVPMIADRSAIVGATPNADTGPANVNTPVYQPANTTEQAASIVQRRSAVVNTRTSAPNAQTGNTPMFMMNTRELSQTWGAEHVHGIRCIR